MIITNSLDKDFIITSYLILKSQENSQILRTVNRGRPQNEEYDFNVSSPFDPKVPNLLFPKVEHPSVLTISIDLLHPKVL